MLIKFSSSATGSFSMFGHVATALVQAMTGTGRDEGALKGRDIEDALNRLQQRLQQQGAAPVAREREPGDEDEDDEEDEPINLSVRAVPLLEMLEAACADVRGGDHETYVMWQPE